MFTRPFRLDRFLRSLWGSEPFIEYCRDRRIVVDQPPSGAPGAADVRRWALALGLLPPDLQVQVELELATVNELAGSDGNAHLVEAAGDGALPPDAVASGAPLALWFLLRRRELFQEVFFRHEIQEVTCWRTARGPAGIPTPDTERGMGLLAEELSAFFRLREGTGRYCTAEGHALPGATCVVAQVADRPQFVEVFTDDGRPARRRLRPARPILFVYYPGDGTVLLKSSLRAQDRVRELLGCFGRTVLGVTLEASGAAYDLDRLKQPFRPLPDAEDMELIRVKALHLRYPGRLGRRQIKLETLSGDGTSAIEQMLRTHVDPGMLAQLQVCHAELEVGLRVAGGRKTYRIRLWPDRTDIGQTPLGDRFRLCLKRWGLTHGR